MGASTIVVGDGTNVGASAIAQNIVGSAESKRQSRKSYSSRETSQSRSKIGRAEITGGG